MFQFIGIKDFDWTMFFVVMIICALGVLQIFSATHDTVWQGSWWKQVIYIAAGIFLMWIATSMDYHALMSHVYPLYIASLVALIAVLAIGKQAFGSTRWIALPAGKEEIAPTFQHYAASDLPVVTDRGITARIIAGGAFGATSPVAMVSPWFYVEVTAEAGVSVPLDADHEERAIYIVDGEVEIANERYEGPRLLVFRPGDRITVKTLKPVRMMFLGGDALEGPRHIWWNFVSSSKERIEQAKQDWKSGRFAHVPNEHEFIPLPE